MSWTKRQFVLQAFEAIGYANYVFDLQAEQLQSALYKLDSMMAMWNGRGIRLGYPLPSSPTDSDLDKETAVPDSANEAIWSNLAIRIAPSVGKTASAELKATARESYDLLLSIAARPNEMQFPDTLPMGQGNKPWRTTGEFAPTPDDPLLAGGDSELEFS